MKTQPIAQSREAEQPMLVRLTSLEIFTLHPIIFFSPCHARYTLRAEVLQKFSLNVKKVSETSGEFHSAVGFVGCVVGGGFLELLCE